MSAPSGFDPTVSLLQQNSTAQIHPFRGGGGSVEPFYKALRKAASLEQQNELPEAIEIKNFAISVEDGNFVLTLRIKQKKKAKKVSDDDNIKGLARDFLIMEAARQFLVAQKVEGNASSASPTASPTTVSSIASSPTVSSPTASSPTASSPGNNKKKNTKKASNVVTAAIATGTVAKAAEAGTVGEDEGENENEDETGTQVVTGTETGTETGTGAQAGTQVVTGTETTKKNKRLTTVPSGLIVTIPSSSTSGQLARTGSSNPVTTPGPQPIRKGAKVTTLVPSQKPQ